MNLLDLNRDSSNTLEEASQQSSRNGSASRSSLTSETNQDIGAMLAKEMNQLSVRERNDILEELHGVDELVDETPELLQQAFGKLEEEIMRIKHKPAYEMALQMDRDYIYSVGFRLLFLRCELFNERKAAVRLIKFMELKKELFGAHTLTRSLYLEDLDENDMKALESGFAQALPVRNRSGRIVCCDFPNVVPAELIGARSMMKAWLFERLALVENDEETQRRGAVAIMSFLVVVKGSKKPSRAEQRQVSKLPDALPLRLTGLHICTNDFLVRTFERLLIFTLSKAVRIRLRIHSGSSTECIYSLMTFGIPVDHLPIDGDNLKNGNHQKWIARQKVRDSLIKRDGVFSGIDTPRRFDVLLGRGKNFQEHLGNQYMRREVEARVEDYQSSSREGKLDLINKVFGDIQSQHGRFLRRDKDGWFLEVSESVATEKVASSFRTFMSVLRKNARNGRLTSSPEPEFVETSNGKRSRLSVDPGLSF